MSPSTDKTKPAYPLEDWQQFLKLTSRIANSFYAEEALSAAVQMLWETLECQAVAVLTLEPDTEYLEIKISRGLSASFVKRFRRPVGTAVVGEVIRGRSALLFDDIDRRAKEYQGLKLEHDFASALCAPLTINNRSLGYLFCQSARQKHFNTQALQFVQVVANLLACAIDKDRMYALNRELTIYDEGTCCYSYSYFYKRLSEEIERCLALREKCSLLLLDVDNLENFCEVHGHQAGQKLCADLAQVVKKNLRVFDLLASYGRDEIIAYLPRTDREQALTVAEKMRRVVEVHEQDLGRPAITVSVGISTLPDHGQSAERLLHAAQVALFQAQRQGRNRVVVAGL